MDVTVTVSEERILIKDAATSEIVHTFDDYEIDTLKAVASERGDAWPDMRTILGHAEWDSELPAGYYQLVPGA